MKIYVNNICILLLIKFPIKNVQIIMIYKNPSYKKLAVGLNNFYWIPNYQTIKNKCLLIKFFFITLYNFKFVFIL